MQGFTKKTRILSDAGFSETLLKLIDRTEKKDSEIYKKANVDRKLFSKIRNNMDYNYEENIAEVNKLIYPEMEYVYFRAENVAVSSSMVKELHAYGQDISKYVPKHTLAYMLQQ